MNIWYYNHYAGGPGIGSYTRAFHLAQAWKLDGHECTVLVARNHHLLDSSPLPQEFFADGIRYVSLPAPPYRGNGLSRLLNMMAYCVSGAFARPTAAPPNVVIASSPHPFSIFPAWLAARRFKAKLVFEVRDIWPLSLTELMGMSSLHPMVILAGISERFAYRHSDVVISLLGAAEPHMRAKGLPPGRFLYAPNGIEALGASRQPTTEHGVAAASQIEKWKQEGRLVVIHPGSQGAHNALNFLIQAADLLRQRRDVGILLVGSGRATEDLKTQVRELGLDNVVFISPVPKAEAIWLTEQSDIGYIGAQEKPDLYKFGVSPNKVFDYMLAAVPIVLAFYAKGDPVSSSGGGVVVPSSDPADIAASLSLLLDMAPEQRKQMGLLGQRYVLEHHDYNTIARRIIEAIQAA